MGSFSSLSFGGGGCYSFFSSHVYVGVCVLFLGFGFEVFFGSCVCVLHLHVMLSFLGLKLCNSFNLWLHVIA
jgi:hypothetical protein